MPDAGRVIAGSAGGIRLLAPGDGTRPLADRVKQALFGSLESELDDAWAWPFLDLFAGSGAGGIESLSRGAPSAVLVERDADAARTIEQNLRRARVEGATVVRRDVLAWLSGGRAVAGLEARFGAALVDPPYAETALLDAALARLGDPGLDWLRDDAVVVAKHFWRDRPPGTGGRLSAFRERRFGETALTMYRVAP